MLFFYKFNNNSNINLIVKLWLTNWLIAPEQRKIICWDKRSYNKRFHSRRMPPMIVNKSRVRLSSESKPCSLLTRRKSLLDHLNNLQNSLVERVHFRFHQKTRLIIARNAVGACAVYHTICSAAASAGRRKSFPHANLTSSSDSRSGCLTEIGRFNR